MKKYVCEQKKKAINYQFLKTKKYGFNYFKK